MKRKIFVLAMALLVLTGCSNSTPDQPQDTSAPDAGSVSGDVIPEGKTVSPLPSTVSWARRCV